MLRYIIITSTTTISVNTTQQFAAQAYYSDGSVQDATSLVLWSSSNTAVAIITAAGVASGTGGGVATVAATATPGSTATITATLGSVVSVPPAVLTVSGPVPVSLQVSPANPTIAIGNTEAFTAQEVWSDGSLHTPSGAVTWASGATTTATILTNSGVAVGLAAGTSIITATEGTLQPGTTELVIDPTGKILAVPNIGTGSSASTVSVFTLGTGGALSTETSVAASTSPQYLNTSTTPREA